MIVYRGIDKFSIGGFQRTDGAGTSYHPLIDNHLATI